MNLKQLEAFVKVTESGSFSKAAKLLFLTQPTVSAHISSLEKELDSRLFVRNTKEVKLIKNKLYKEKVKGFYVHAKTEIKSAKIAAKYVGRYVGRPAIAESRILKYDGKNVTYKYTRHEDNKVIVETVHVYEFIKRIIRQCPLL